MTTTNIRVRFAMALVAITAGAIIGIGAFTLPGQTERWVAFAGGALVLLSLAVAVATPQRGTLQRALDLPLALMATWAMVSARVIESTGAGSSPHDIKWLSISVGAGIMSVGVISLIAHELDLERRLRRACDELRQDGSGAANDRWAAASAAAHADIPLTSNGGSRDAQTWATGR